MIVLSIPLKKVHPGIKDGTLESDVLSKLNGLSVNELTQQIQVQGPIEVKEENTDPRWDELKKLLTDK